MKTRQLGNTDLNLTEIGFGAWAIGGEDWKFGWGPQDDKKSVEAISAALDLGMNWIDTAAIYGLGHSEEVVAQALEGKRQNVIVATKCSQVWDKEGDISQVLKAESIKRECENSLRRLRTDFIDLYQIHWPADEENIEEGWEAMSQLQKDGKIRYAAVSNFRLEHLKRAQPIHPIASLQPPYSIIRRTYEMDGEFDFCRKNKIGVVAYSPMQSGLLTGKFDIKRVAGTDWRRGSVEFKEPNLLVNLWFADQLKPIAEKYEHTVAQLAIAWTLRDPVVTSSIVGARTRQQVEEIVGGADWKLLPEDLLTIDNLIAERNQKLA